MASFAATAIQEKREDIELVHAAKGGDVEAFGELVNRYDRQLFRVAQNITHNREDAQDAVQEAFLKAFENLGAFEEKAKFSTWLVRIVINQSLMKLRKQRSANIVSVDEDFENPEHDAMPLEIADWNANPEKDYKATELREILTKALEGLSRSLRIVFVLRDMEGLSVEETARVLDLSVAAVKTRLLRARLELRARLTRYFEKGTTMARAALLREVTLDPERWRQYV
jgi:RNA polymerase sigma-70 factor (ECF subfamily)